MRKEKLNGEIVEFLVPTLEEQVQLVLYDKKSLLEEKRIPFQKIPQENLVRGSVSKEEINQYAYHYLCGKRAVTDKSAHSFVKSNEYGEMGQLPCKLAVTANHEFDWEGVRRPELPYEEMIVYLAHVRGFTMHSSSKVKGKGTFYGMMQKIPYLKELGITTVELQPIYEYEECGKKVNYWGYQEGLYYAPKASYSYQEDSVAECKEMVKAFHKEGMEVILQFYFPSTVSRLEILNILRFWSFYYQVDGFHLMGENIPVLDLAKDTFLQSRKLWYYDFPVEDIYPGKDVPEKKVLASYQDGYMYDMRRFLKGDESCVYGSMKRMMSNPPKMGMINYFTNYYGLTMWDMVSYERKHNEGNGEDNADGNDYNGSWNCGQEGPSRKKTILALRKKQYKNAFALLMLSQGTPLFFMGDEFANSQGGNNNPYCQDNETTWLNWNDLNKNKELYSYVKELIGVRKSTRIFHMKKECMLMDYLSCGYPDLSYHGEEAYMPSWGPHSRQVGVLLCGDYAGEKGILYYIAINMHWEEHSFAYPKLKKDSVLECVFTTDEACRVEQERIILSPRSICIYTIKRKH